MKQLNQTTTDSLSAACRQELDATYPYSSSANTQSLHRLNHTTAQIVPLRYEASIIKEMSGSSCEQDPEGYIYLWETFDASPGNNYICTSTNTSKQHRDTESENNHCSLSQPEITSLSSRQVNTTSLNSQNLQENESASFTNITGIVGMTVYRTWRVDKHHTADFLGHAITFDWTQKSLYQNARVFFLSCFGAILVILLFMSIPLRPPGNVSTKRGFESIVDDWGWYIQAIVASIMIDMAWFVLYTIYQRPDRPPYINFIPSIIKTTLVIIFVDLIPRAYSEFPVPLLWSVFGATTCVIVGQYNARQFLLNSVEITGRIVKENQKLSWLVRGCFRSNAISHKAPLWLTTAVHNTPADHPRSMHEPTEINASAKYEVDCSIQSQSHLQSDLPYQTRTITEPSLRNNSNSNVVSDSIPRIEDTNPRRPPSFIVFYRRRFLVLATVTLLMSGFYIISIFFLFLFRLTSTSARNQAVVAVFFGVVNVVFRKLLVPWILRRARSGGSTFWDGEFHDRFNTSNSPVYEDDMPHALYDPAVSAFSHRFLDFYFELLSELLVSFVTPEIRSVWVFAFLVAGEIVVAFLTGGLWLFTIPAPKIPGRLTISSKVFTKQTDTSNKPLSVKTSNKSLHSKTLNQDVKEDVPLHKPNKTDKIYTWLEHFSGVPLGPTLSRLARLLLSPTQPDAMTVITTQSAPYNGYAMSLSSQHAHRLSKSLRKANSSSPYGQVNINRLESLVREFQVLQSKQFRHNISRKSPKMSPKLSNAIVDSPNSIECITSTPVMHINDTSYLPPLPPRNQQSFYPQTTSNLHPFRNKGSGASLLASVPPPPTTPYKSLPNVVEGQVYNTRPPSLSQYIRNCILQRHAMKHNRTQASRTTLSNNRFHTIQSSTCTNNFDWSQPHTHCTTSQPFRRHISSACSRQSTQHSMLETYKSDIVNTSPSDVRLVVTSVIQNRQPIGWNLAYSQQQRPLNTHFTHDVTQRNTHLTHNVTRGNSIVNDPSNASRPISIKSSTCLQSISDTSINSSTRLQAIKGQAINDTPINDTSLSIPNNTTFSDTTNKFCAYNYTTYLFPGIFTRRIAHQLNADISGQDEEFVITTWMLGNAQTFFLLFFAELQGNLCFLVFFTLAVFGNNRESYPYNGVCSELYWTAMLYTFINLVVVLIALGFLNYVVRRRTGINLVSAGLALLLHPQCAFYMFIIGIISLLLFWTFVASETYTFSFFEWAFNAPQPGETVCANPS